MFRDPVVSTALLDRLLHHAELMPGHVRSKAILAASLQPPPPRRRGRPPKNGYAAQVA